MASIAETRGSNEGSESRKIIDFLPLRSNNQTSSRECNDLIIANSNARIRDVANGGLEIALSSQFHEESNHKMKIDASTSASPLEYTAENNLHLPFGNDACGKNDGELPRGNSIQIEASPTHSKSSLHRSKGKEKVFSDESHESVESCNSVELFSKGKKRWGVEREMVVGSKRVRKEIEESPFSPSFVRQDSSFMNWISNMVKGLNKSDEDEDPTLTLTLSHPNPGRMSDNREIITCNRNRNMGFQTIFQSLYCPNSKEQETGMCDITPIASHSDRGNFGSEFFKPYEADPSVEPKTSSAIVVTTPRICEMNSSENTSSKKIACGKVENGRSSFSSSFGIERNPKSYESKSNTPSEAKVVSNVGCGSEPLRSLWITRFSAKTRGPLMNLFHSCENSSGALEHSSDGARPIVKETSTEAKENLIKNEVNGVDKDVEIHGNGDQKLAYKLNSILPSPKHKSSEAMASVFAKRMDALKHIKLSDGKDDLNHFFCGINVHDLCDCTEKIETERENFVGNFASWDKAEGSPCSTSKRNGPISSDKGILCSYEAQKPIIASSSSGDNVLKEKQIGSLDNLVDQKVSYVPKGMFDAIKKLRLTRMDILKWMNSATSLSHLDGFFLRLRLGKWEGGLLGTGYHVACITGEQIEISSQGRKNPISVSIGGVRCSVESQYISNQDFLEGELMAWWCSTLRTGGKIPSEVYLKMKLEKRKILGF